GFSSSPGATDTQKRWSAAPERLCFLSRGNCGEFWIPWRVVFQHGVESHEKLAGAGSEDDLGCLAAGFEALGEGADAGRFDVGVMNKVESRQVDCRANAGTSAEDGSFALIFATVTVEGCDADEGRDLLAIEFAEFRKFGQ